MRKHLWFLFFTGLGGAQQAQKFNRYSVSETSKFG